MDASQQTRPGDSMAKVPELPPAHSDQELQAWAMQAAVRCTAI
eukprot:CAMPEP_0172734678 /NCGR_PEP_ID=MMETSP1074-20121228/110480_1 /TAXON_ID=2916 /ORGANISM="Ceratium fusus, Strain PA161109" /LENGTH=42 /DNA_ID= /DNA_START= /DNA_END= /DNA_ORIENTATION=